MKKYKKPASISYSALEKSEGPSIIPAIIAAVGPVAAAVGGAALGGAAAGASAVAARKLMGDISTKEALPSLQVVKLVTIE